MLIIVTDTYHQVNGVSTTYKNLEKIAATRNVDLKIIHPGLFRWVPMPFYPEIQLSIQPIRLWQLLNKLNPKRIHIATEGAMGIVARTWCRWHKRTFTSAYHTRFPEYLQVMLGIPERFTYWYMRQFHAAAKATFVTTRTLKEELNHKGFDKLVVWTRGVSQELIAKQNRTNAGKRLRVLYVGRISKEKNLDALCTLEQVFDITIVGNGPYLAELRNRYAHVQFTGYKFGQELAQIYAEHDVFAFPSRTDTFGIVMIEAMCNGLPVAAYNVAGPKDVVESGITGILGDDLYQSIMRCKILNRAVIQEKARHTWTWDNCFDIFIQQLRTE